MGLIQLFSTVDQFKQVNTAGAVALSGDQLRKYQRYLLGIAEDIISVCEEEGVTYHLTGGSALGAVRHGGFIPWDDDMDIDILGSDFDRFEKAFLARFSDKYWLHTYRKKNYGILVNRVRLKNSVFRAREDSDNDECGFFVDIIRIENTYDNPILRFMHGMDCMGMGFLLSCRNYYFKRKSVLALAARNKRLAAVLRVKIFIGMLISFRSLDRWAEKTQRCYSRCKNNHSKYVSVPAGRRHFFGELYRRTDFVESDKASFEEHMWNVPRNYDLYLTNMYGDYMTVPDPNAREEHVVLEIRFPDEKNETAGNGRQEA
ncbi:MAG: LicD family protein [Clostridia bacterium]|nr:LicD family protein [Clostridia bacterium]